MTARDNLKVKWWRWHKANPHIYELFKKFTLQAIRSGHYRLSAWLIVNRIRWETTVETKGNDFKISNDYIAFYARLFMHDYPEFDGVFKVKNMKRATIKEV